MIDALAGGSLSAGTLRAAPERDCGKCPRLVELRHRLRGEHGDWHNAPVPSFGPPDASLLVVGLAPGMQGANRTGRPFTGDYAGDVLYPALIRHGWARGRFAARPDDGLELADCRITNAVRCLPPQNKPIGQEINACRSFLSGELIGAQSPKAVLALGRIAFDSTLRALGHKPKDYGFAHGAVHRLPPPAPILVASYHCSRYNINTGRLTEAMFEDVMSSIDNLLNPT